MKKSISLILSLVTCISLTYCGRQSENEKTKSISSDITTSESNKTTTISKSEQASTTTAKTSTTYEIFTTTTTTTTSINVCDEMTNILEKSNYTLNDIENSSQIIAVDSNGFNCTVYGFEKKDSCWETIFSTSGFVGGNGVSDSSHEGDYCTPMGLFPLGFAFGTESIDDLSIEYRKINENCYWVDDPLSEYYNQWCETTNIQWNSAEHLIDYSGSYHYAVSINYNMNPVVPYAGSAIFLHCSSGSSTAGCVSVPESYMLEILHWLREDSSPMILIM